MYSHEELGTSNHTERPEQCEQRVLRGCVREQQQQEQHERSAVFLRISTMDKEYITIEEVEEAYYDCRKNKRGKRSSLEYELNYEVNNVKLWQDLNSMTYEVGRSLAFCVTRPKIREVFAADFRDRIVHHILIRKFGGMLEAEMIDDSYNCRVGKGTLFGANMVRKHIEDVSCNYTRMAWVMKCDLQGFFMSLDKDVLWVALETLIRSNYHGADVCWWLWLWRKVVFNRPELNCIKVGDLSLFDRLSPDKTLFKSDGRGLPIGNLTSQILANYYMTAFDRWVVKRIGKDGRYGRYVDDFVIVHTDKNLLLELARDSRLWLKDNLHLTLHPRKFYLQPVFRGLELSVRG